MISLVAAANGLIEICFLMINRFYPIPI